MNENLVGYVLNALEDHERLEVEQALAHDPEARRRLDLLQQGLEPLAADAGPDEPPANLWERTLERLDAVRSGPSTKPQLRLASAVSRAWWRRADVLVAASILLVALSLVPSGLVTLQRHRDRLHCQENLRLFHEALMTYCDAHGDSLPKVEAAPPRNFAGVFVPILRDSGVFAARLGSGTTSLTCGLERSASASAPSNLSLEALERLNPEQRAREAIAVGGGYAYVLGYQDDSGRLYGLRRETGNDRLPILADCPPFRPQTAGQPRGNSLNHGGTGQNVLYLGGQVSFCTQRTVGVNGDDIYLNKRNEVAAGLNRWDTVLGASSARPLPNWDE